MSDKPLIAIFGASGFIGRHISRVLSQQDYSIRIITRNAEKAKFLDDYTGVQDITYFEYNPDDIASVTEAVSGADYVINLIGILYESGNSRFEAVHIGLPDKIAQACANENIKAFIHMSALGADNKAASKYAVSKARGEERVFSRMDKALVLRPSVVFGPEDNFINMFAKLSKYLPYLPLIGGGHTKFQPVYVEDVARAVSGIVTKLESGDSSPLGKVYELGGPDVYSFKDIMKMLLHVTGRKRFLLPIPWSAAAAMGKMMNVLPKPLLTADQVKLLKTDNVVSGQTATFEDLEIKPEPMKPIISEYIKV